MLKTNIQIKKNKVPTVRTDLLNLQFIGTNSSLRSFNFLFLLCISDRVKKGLNLKKNSVGKPEPSRAATFRSEPESAPGPRTSGAEAAQNSGGSPTLIKK